MSNSKWKWVYYSQPEFNLGCEFHPSISEDIKNRLGTSNWRLIRMELPENFIMSPSVMSTRIKLLLDADLVVFSQKWRDAQPCVLEHAICDACGLPIMDLSNTK